MSMLSFGSLPVADSRPSHTSGTPFLFVDLWERWMVGHFWIPAESGTFPFRNKENVGF